MVECDSSRLTDSPKYGKERPDPHLFMIAHDRVSEMQW